MPKLLPWVTVFSKSPKKHLDAYLAESKTMIFKTSNKTACTLCPSSSEPHKMVYQLAWCNSTKCAALALLMPCTWRGRIDTCAQSGLTSVSELSHHATPVASPKANQLTRAMRSFTRDMTARNMKPAQIRNSIIETLNLDETSAPTLDAVQNCVSNYRRAHMSNSDLVDTLVELAQRYQCSPMTEKDDVISLGYERDGFDLPEIGDGTNGNPFIFGLTTISMIKLLDNDPEKFIFHIDATFKLNQSGYPVIVCGITGQDRSFRPLAFFIESQRTGPIFARVLQSMCVLFHQLVRRPLRIKYVMGDADDAQHNAASAILGQHHDVIYLMCFYHVVAKVSERVKCLPRPTRKEIFDDVYDMHFSRSQHELESVLARA